MLEEKVRKWYFTPQMSHIIEHDCSLDHHIVTTSNMRADDFIWVDFHEQSPEGNAYPALPWMLTFQGWLPT